MFISVFLQIFASSDLVERPNGYFITGRGCGVTNPLRYLNFIPEKIEEYECSFIELEKSKPVLLTGWVKQKIS